MVTISKKVEYSLVFILYLADHKDKKVSLTDASKKLFLPYRFLGQIATDLKQSKIIESKEGKSGGYTLVDGWEKKSIYDLVESLGEMKSLVKCGNCGRGDNCRVKNVFDKIENSFSEELKKLKLNEIAV